MKSPGVCVAAPALACVPAARGARPGLKGAVRALVQPPPDGRADPTRAEDPGLGPEPGMGLLYPYGTHWGPGALPCAIELY